jgi:hypothetical protein
MTQSADRPVFHPITPRTDVSDEELAAFASSKGVGTLVQPAAQTSPAAPQIAQEAPRDLPRPPRHPPPPGKHQRPKKPPQH